MEKIVDSNATHKYQGNGGLLWKVVNGATTMYIQGTIHVGHEQFFPLAAEIEAAYTSANIVLPEINMLNVEMDQNRLSALARLEDGQTLADILSEKSYSKLSALFKDQDLAIENHLHKKPWFIELLLGAFIREACELSPAYGVDLYFLQRAAQDGKEIVELETTAGQYDVFSGYSLSTQVQMLEKLVDDYENQAHLVDQLGFNWIHSHQPHHRRTLKQLLVDDLNRGGDHYQQEMSERRNIQMANKLDAILKSNCTKTYFVIIGSGHTLIPPSIPSELTIKGYHVEDIY